jgi:hypothetical protein
MQQNVPHSSILKTDVGDDGYYIEHIQRSNGEMEYRSVSPDGEKSRFSADLWQAEIYREMFRRQASLGS